MIKENRKITLDKFAFYLMLFLVVVVPFQAFFVTWLKHVFSLSGLTYFLVSAWKEAILGALSILALTIFLKERRKFKIKSVDKFILAFLALVLLYFLIFNLPISQKIAGIRYDCEFLFFYLLARYFIFTEKQLKVMLYSFLTISVPVIIFGLLQISYLPPEFLEKFGYSRNLGEYLKTGIIPTYESVNPTLPDIYRIQSTFPGAIHFGSYLILVTSIFVSYAAVFFKQKKIFLLFTALSLVSIFALYSTQTRSAWIGVLASVASIAFLLIKNKKKLYIWTGAVVLSGTALVALFFNNPKVQTLLLHGEIREGGLFGSTKAHWEALIFNLKNALANPLGQGIGFAGPASKNAQSVITENWYLQIILELGIIGLLLFVAMIYQFIKELNKILRKTQDSFLKALSLALIASFVGISVSSLFLHSWADTATVYPLLIFSGVLISLNIDKLDIIKEKEKM